MNDLTKEIQEAQKLAGEQVVLKHLQQKGLAPISLEKVATTKEYYIDEINGRLMLRHESGEIIGRVYSENTWVKRGMRFEEKDWQWSGACGASEIQFKCPVCQKFNE